MVCPRAVKALVFPVVMYGCERWTIKKSEHQRIDAFELWCLRRLFRVPWTARRSNQSILKEINSEYSLEGLMLKHQYFGLRWRQEGKRTTEDGSVNGTIDMVGWHYGLNGHEFEPALAVGDGLGGLVCCSPWGCKEIWLTELNWTEPLDGTYAWILVILLKTISILERSHVCQLYILN